MTRSPVSFDNKNRIFGNVYILLGRFTSVFPTHALQSGVSVKNMRGWHLWFKWVVDTLPLCPPYIRGMTVFERLRWTKRSVSTILFNARYYLQILQSQISICHFHRRSPSRGRLCLIDQRATLQLM